jgi:predicted glycogen debranching enzyme
MNETAPRTVDFGREICADLGAGESREWLVTNGIGGFASGTIAGSLTRRYHGLLVAALKPPVGRTLLVTKLDETGHCGEAAHALATNRWQSGAIDPHGYHAIERFRLAGTTPVWTFAIADALLEKRIWMEHGRNITYVEYRLVRAAGPFRLALRALVNYRDFHGATHAGDWRMQIEPRDAALRILPYAEATPIWLAADRGELRSEHEWWRDFALWREAERGLDSTEDHLLAASLEVELDPANPRVTVVLSAEDAAPAIDTGALDRRSARDEMLTQSARAALSINGCMPGWVEQLVLSADGFVVSRPTASDPGAVSIIAGYHWFGDWGRDTMIALPGIALATGRPAIAANVLRNFARFIDGGMLPNYFPDAGQAPEYNTVDAALWYVEAVRAYDATTGDTRLARDLFATLVSIVDAYERGTRYGIGVDSADGLVFAGEPGVQLTWMDAKVGDWVVTPRIGKAVEINALWYNALRTLEVFARRDQDANAAERFAQLAERAAAGFERFWDAARGYCLDVLDGPDGNAAAFRPNALFAVSLAHTPLSPDRCKSIVDACGARLVSSYGLRSLEVRDKQYRGHYGGPPVERDGAYHQGTVWGWLIGPWVMALLRTGTPPEIARSYLEPFRHHVQGYGLGTLCEIADGDPPFTPNGCIAQAWTVANVLSAWRATTPNAANPCPVDGGTIANLPIK